MDSIDVCRSGTEVTARYHWYKLCIVPVHLSVSQDRRSFSSFDSLLSPVLYQYLTV